MKRVLWTAGLALVALWFGWFAQGYPFSFLVLAIFTAWGGFIGFGFGTIFAERAPTGRLIAYWAITSTLVCSMMFPLVPFHLRLSQIAAAALGALWWGFWSGFCI